MIVSKHIKASLIISIILFFWWKSFFYSAVSFLAGTAIDVDHFFDYIMLRGIYRPIKWIRDFYKACTNIEYKNLYLMLHSFEFLIIFWSIIYKFCLGKFWIAIAIGFAQHLILDHLFNPVQPLMYFLSFRIYNKFKTIHLLDMDSVDFKK